MSGHTIASTHTTTSTVCGAAGDVAGPVSRRLPFALSRAARELDFEKGEFELAVHLGHVRTVPGGPGGGRRATRAEIDRVRGEDGLPETLRHRVKAVGTWDGGAREARRDRPLAGPLPIVQDLRAPDRLITRHRGLARQESSPSRGVFGWLRRRDA